MARYIDANELQKRLEQVAKEPDYMHDGETWDLGVCLAGTIVDQIPTADVVEVKHGEWITLEAEIGLYSCSLCGHKILRAECNYCPNCGAKMDGGKTDE